MVTHTTVNGRMIKSTAKAFIPIRMATHTTVNGKMIEEVVVEEFLEKTAVE